MSIYNTFIAGLTLMFSQTGHSVLYQWGSAAVRCLCNKATLSIIRIM